VARTCSLKGEPTPQPQCGTRTALAGGRCPRRERQHDVAGSEGFDWNYVATLWPLMRDTRDDWMTTRPGLPAAHDRAGWRRIESPLGRGNAFGHRAATQRHVCMFGGRFKLPADMRLGRPTARSD
jgi:hypothetical protein